ncbi:MAG: PIG-L family deacetylase [Planctomycetota bacterium]|nr:PIG-L family deacetylase [Planctomycetota bacterium]
MSKVAFAAAAHPDDIELMMAGTLILLGEAGYELHYMNVANGSCGTATMDYDEVIAVRTAEARAAAGHLGATFHEPLVDDLQIYYTPSLTAKLCAIIRLVRPDILLLPSPQDYMEDHVNVSRLAVTAAFCRNMRNFITDPAVAPTGDETALYHALPWGLNDQYRRPIEPDLYVDISSVIERKREALASHRSQKEWLDESQGHNSYLNTMVEMSKSVGGMSGRFDYAEGWIRHSHLGFGAEDFDPLSKSLGDLVVRG